jgi:quercetin dioxygenase-like cupin family protein
VNLQPFGEAGIGGEILIPAQLNNQVSLSLIKLGADEAFAPHFHPSDHILVIMEGSGQLDCSEGDSRTVYELREGDVVPVPSQLVHAFAATAEGCTFLAFAVPARPLKHPERLVPVAGK